MTKKVMIKHNPYGDTRTAPKDTTYKQFQKANSRHIKEVDQVLCLLAHCLRYQGLSHDRTKKEFERDFFNDFKLAQEGKINFTEGQWYQRHVHIERHHPESFCHDDINLLDILETIVDCVCAGKARSGKIRDIKIDTDILVKAVNNTIDLINKMTELKE